MTSYLLKLVNDHLPHKKTDLFWMEMSKQRATSLFWRWSVITSHLKTAKSPFKSIYINCRIKKCRCFTLINSDTGNIYFKPGCKTSGHTISFNNSNFTITNDVFWHFYAKQKALQRYAKKRFFLNKFFGYFWHSFQAIPRYMFVFYNM